ncbi:MAG TPA: SRPBCC family protein [Terriglobales bacterium]
MKWILTGALLLAGVLIVVVIVGALLPKQHVARRSITLNASPEAVWSLISGPPTWRPDVKSYEELPSRNGHRVWRETDKHGQTITYEAIEAAAPTHLVTKIADPKLPFGGTWTYEITQNGTGALLTITENGEVYNPVFRFVSRFVMGHTAGIDAYLKTLQARVGGAKSASV